MFPQVSPSLFALDFASLMTIAFFASFVFMVLRIAFPATPLDSHLYKLPGGCGGKAGKTVGRVCAMGTNKPAFINLRTLVVPKKSDAFVFSQIQTLWAKHPGWGALTTRRCSESRSFPGVKIGPQLGKLPPTRLGAIIPLCTPNIWQRAFVSLANCHRFSWG